MEISFYHKAFFVIIIFSYHKIIEPTPCNVNWSEFGNRVLLGLVLTYLTVSDLLPEFICKLILPKYYLSKKLKQKYLQKLPFLCICSIPNESFKEKQLHFLHLYLFPPKHTEELEQICTNPAPGLTLITRRYFDQYKFKVKSLWI